jgi:hypothetical protein
MIFSFAADLRAQLAAVINTSHTHGYNDIPASSPSPHGHNIDPAIAGQDIMRGSAESGGDDSMGDGRKGGKRELSQSKRAAQNRAAQVRPLLFCFCFAIIHKRCNVWMSTEFSLDGLLCFVNSHVIHHSNQKLT